MGMFGLKNLVQNLNLHLHSHFLANDSHYLANPTLLHNRNGLFQIASSLAALPLLASICPTEELTSLNLT